MSQTVIGIFETLNQAQEAKAYLTANGFSSENVDLSHGNASTYHGKSERDEEGFGARISKFFSDLFDDDQDVSSHVSAAKNGSTITVHTRTEHETLQAVKILDNFGALDVNEFSEKARSVSTTDSIPVIEEELQVGKREVETGSVRLRSRIVERPVEQSIRLREEHVNIERTPVDRPATEADFDEFEEGTIEVTEHAEIPVVSKEARVIEEVSLDKEVTETQETISDTVRHTEVDTEELPSSERTYRDTTDPDKL